MSKMKEQMEFDDEIYEPPKNFTLEGQVEQYIANNPVQARQEPAMETLPAKSSTFLPMGEEGKMMGQWAEMVAASPYYQKEGGKAGIISKWLAAKELGIPPMVALNGGLHYVQGCIQLSATAMNMLIRRKGHSINKIEHNGSICHIKGTRRDNGDTSESIFTIEQAKNAGLMSKSIWKQYPERMLFNRALSNLAKDLFADCIGNAYVEGELEEEPIKAPPVEVEADESTQAFIDKHNLLDEDNPLSKFIDRVASVNDKRRIEVIADAAKNEEKFLNSFDNYNAKKK